jgi:hypothetical protein
VRHDGEGDHEQAADDADPPGQSRVAGVEERMGGGDETPGPDEEVEVEEHRQSVGRDGPGGEPCRPDELEQAEGQRPEQDRRREEGEGRPWATVDQLAEARYRHRADGRKDPPTVHRPPGRPDRRRRIRRRRPVGWSPPLGSGGGGSRAGLLQAVILVGGVLTVPRGARSHRSLAPPDVGTPSDRSACQ